MHAHVVWRSLHTGLISKNKDKHRNLMKTIQNKNRCMLVVGSEVPLRQPEDGQYKPKHVVVHYIVIKYSSCDTVVFDYIQFSKFHTHNGGDTLPRSVEKIQGSLKCDKNNGHLTRRPIYINDSISLKKGLRQNLYRKSKNTNFVFNNIFSHKILAFH